MIDRRDVIDAAQNANCEHQSSAVDALVRWADEARAAILLVLQSRTCPFCGRYDPEHGTTCALAALLAEWPKEADRG